MYVFGSRLCPSLVAFEDGHDLPFETQLCREEGAGLELSSPWTGPTLCVTKSRGTQIWGKVLTTLMLASSGPWEPHEGGIFPLKALVWSIAHIWVRRGMGEAGFKS